MSIFRTTPNPATTLMKQGLATGAGIAAGAVLVGLLSEGLTALTGYAVKAYKKATTPERKPRSRSRSRKLRSRNKK